MYRCEAALRAMRSLHLASRGRCARGEASTTRLCAALLGSCWPYKVLTEPLSRLRCSTEAELRGRRLHRLVAESSTSARSARRLLTPSPRPWHPQQHSRGSPSLTSSRCACPSLLSLPPPPPRPPSSRLTPRRVLLARLLLQASLEAHNASFDELLKHVPAKYYLRPDSDDEDSQPKVPQVRRVALSLSLSCRSAAS